MASVVEVPVAAVKDEISSALIAALARDLGAAWPAFDRRRFTHMATKGLADLEFKARVTHVASALQATLPDDVAQAEHVIRRAVEAGGIASWASLPVTEYISATMLEHPERGLPLLAALTGRLSAEFAVRPFIEAHPQETMRFLVAWVSDPDENVRRLVCEGTRPRLPWAPQLRNFIADPAPTIALLDRLYDDPSEYVRRSVANHLNDIAKDHPELAVATATRWLAATTNGGDYVARHGLRTLVKRGHPGALAALGFEPGVEVALVQLACMPARFAIGDTTTIAFTLRAEKSCRVVIDYTVVYQGVNGPKDPKVFKLVTRDLPAQRDVTFERRHRFGHVSIRRIHPGTHQVGIQVNGRTRGTTEIEVTP